MKAQPARLASSAVLGAALGGSAKIGGPFGWGRTAPSDPDLPFDLGTPSFPTLGIPSPSPQVLGLSSPERQEAEAKCAVGTTPKASSGKDQAFAEIFYSTRKTFIVSSKTSKAKGD